MNTPRRLLGILVTCLLTAKTAHATEFNADFLDVDGAKDVDLAQFTHADYTVPGTYFLDVVVNGRLLAARAIDYVPGNQLGTSVACVPADLVAQIGLKQTLLATLPRTYDGRCIDLLAIDGASVRHDRASARLRIAIPQIAFEYSDPDYIPPAAWSDGIPGALLDYRVIGNTSHGHGTHSSTVQSYGTIGANAGAWRLRGDYQAQLASGGNANFGGSSKTFQFNRLYAFRAFPQIRSTVSLGQSYLNSDIFDTFALDGATLQSDDRMLPPGMRGYAPLITGVAHSNATVTVSQQGRVLYATRVPAGAFALQDFSASVQGTLDVTVQEEDGSEQRFTVQSAAVPFLARAGELRYRTAVGKPRLFGGAGIDPAFGFVEAAYGLPHEITIYGGALGASGYAALAFGVGKNLGAFGAVSADVTTVRARLWWSGETRVGRSYRFNYSKHFDSIDSDVRFFGYRFSDRTYTSFPQYFGDPTAAGLAPGKQRYSISLAKRVMDVSTFVSYDHTSYWNRPSDERIGVTAATAVRIGSLRNVSLNLSAYRTRGGGGSGNQLFVSATIPFGSRQTVTTSVASTSGGGTNVTAGYLGGTDKGLSYSLYAGTTNGAASASGNLRKQFSSIIANVQAAANTRSNTSASIELDGSFVATQHGVTAHANSYNGDTRLLLSTDGVPDVPFSGTQASSDARGYAVIGAVSPFSTFDARVNTNRASLQTTVSNPVQRVVLTDGAIGYVHFDTTHGRNALVVLRLPSGKDAPFGASVVDRRTGKEVGIVGEHGVTYLTGVRKDAELVVRVVDRDICRLPVLPESMTLGADPVPLDCAEPDTLSRR
ncbi:fimbria/pilus outer membrane usher protein [Burkholderia vietnamiensis]|uniref:fimbria/pilus outer membrane usher protein n=1 Tax=Burkholderia vietnamiensis TaxID=60552 RepID=UPI001593A361|nr:fimbria/pilus outer membrane usher protein [Burkholderia vietnamiensis]